MTSERGHLPAGGLVNIGEIARRAGVSRSTVSYALSGKRTVSEVTRRRILQVIDEVGYRPNASARALAEGRTRTIGLVIPPAGRRLTPVQLGFVASIVAAAGRHELDVLLSPSGGDHDRSFERLISGRRVDGVILTEVRLRDARAARLRRSGVPFVSIGHTAGAEAGCWVDLDYEGLIARCVHHLADLGHRAVALVNRPQEFLDSGYGPASRALSGFTAAAAERSIEATAVCCPDEATAGETCVEDLLSIRPEITAIVTVNEVALPGMERALRRLGRAVPERFSVTGVVGRHWAEEFHPPLTAADVPVTEMADRAVALLVERIATPAAPDRHVLLTPPISLRASTAPAR
ncbi:LacI family DNA-binding transcriptional regulator [Sphaerisporangium melleum]|uniref:LacI family DNA-binding transcriptional regulator n=1 Tax=Sphaerisporangium melleum TaxID=321316 RepID=UPI001951E26B|nr:LacI family DNA-binding transcriptional regulator [Sphaerisporangium melleum]